MRNEVDLNGVKVTRQQLEDALIRINQPEDVPKVKGDFAGGFYDGIYLVIDRAEFLRVAEEIQRGGSDVIGVRIKRGNSTYSKIGDLRPLSKYHNRGLGRKFGELVFLEKEEVNGQSDIK